MSGVRFERVALRYGRHAGEWVLPDHGRPVVVAGPNGSGKTTLVEGAMRVLFGFDRRRSQDAGCLAARTPWEGEEVWGAVHLRRGGERYEIRRDFGTGRVRVRAPDEGLDHFHGDGNPGARNQEARQYRQILTDLIGVPELDGYACTLLVQQGELGRTALGEHLLRVAAGGHALVDAARRDLAHAHRAITRRPLHPAAKAAINARELEMLEEEIRRTRARLDAAREAGERRGPLTLERERTAEQLSAVDDEIGRLERAQSALARTDAVELTARQLRGWRRRFELARAELNVAVAELGAARAALADARRDGTYPDDFPERLARAEVRWRDLQQSRGRSSRWVGVVAGGLAAVTLVLSLLDAPVAAVIGGAAAALLALVAWSALLIDGHRRRRAARRELEAILEGVPGLAGSDLTQERRAVAVARYRAQRDAALRLGSAREELAGAITAARRLHREAVDADVVEAVPAGSAMAERVGTGGVEAEPETEVDAAAEAAEAGSEPDDAPWAARRMAARLAAATERVRERLVRGTMELERVGEASLSLPDGVVPTEAGVAEALAERRRERGSLQGALQGINQELLERGTPAESPDALAAALASLEPRLEALELKAAALEAAHALVADAYDEFRDRDQERLVGLVSAHVERLSGGAVGPVETGDSLEDARVRAHGRRVRLETPPLSFGEYHALLLGVRLGAAEFLSGVGIAPPLIIEEPFAHLDRHRARAVWELLSALAAERQVVITTQDSLLLDHLGVAPDIRLGD